ncbi:MAG: MerR family transcriptional regulator [Pseudomonadota bacterium]
MAKSRDAFRTISEVADWLGTQPHVLRFWESKFSQVKPVKRAGGRRYYRPADMALLGGIKQLLHEDGLTIKGAQKILREQGVKYVSGLSPEIDADPGEPAPTPHQEHAPEPRRQEEETMAQVTISEEEAHDIIGLRAVLKLKPGVEPAALVPHLARLRQIYKRLAADAGGF